MSAETNQAVYSIGRFGDLLLRWLNKWNIIQKHNFQKFKSLGKGCILVTPRLMSTHIGLA